MPSRIVPISLLMDVQFFKPFVEGALMTFKVQCSIDAKADKPFIKGKGPKFECEIAAIVGLTCSAFKGTLALYFSKDLFLRLMSNMLGEEFTEITKDLEDGAAELLNIIFGHAKRVLNDKNYDIQKAIPSIIRGKSIQAVHLTSSPVVVLPFTAPEGTFYIEVSTEERKDNV